MNKQLPGLAPTHVCKVCGALWRQCDDGSWNLRSETAGTCCDNATMGEQIAPLATPLPAQVQPAAQVGMIEIAQRNLRAYLSKASFASNVDREAALNCVEVLEQALATPPQPAQAEADVVRLRKALQAILDTPGRAAATRIAVLALAGDDAIEGRPTPSASPSDAEDAVQWRKAVQEAYGWLWHVNNEPMAPVPMWSPESAAYEARKCLRELLTKEQRGEAINAVAGLLRNKADAARPKPAAGEGS